VAQKLLTIFLSRVLEESDAVEVEEHLQEYLDAGWYVKEVRPLPGGGRADIVGGWLVVLLER
jgi:hypothetical protein